VLELNELLELLLLKLIAYQLNILSKVSNLRNLLFFSVSQLLIDVFYIVFDLFLRLDKALAVRLVLSKIIRCHIAGIRLRI
jgi:hypothetical protein